MSVDINLVVEKTFKSPHEKRIAKLRRASLGILGFLAVLSLVLFLINIRLSVNSSQNQQSQIIKDLSSYDQVGVKIFLLHERIKDISSIEENRKNYSALTSEIIDGSVSVKEFSINKSGFSITAESDSLISLNDMLNRILVLSEEKKLSNISLEGLSINAAGFQMIVQGKVI